MPDEKRQLAGIAVVADKLDSRLADLAASVAELRAALGLTTPAAPDAKAVPVTDPPPVPDPGTPPPGDALTTATALQHALESMSGDLQEVSSRLTTTEARERRARRFIRALCVSLALDLALTIGVTVATVSAHTASDRAAAASSRANATVAQLRAIQIAGCEAGNEYRAGQIKTWHYLLSLSPPASPQAQRIADKFIVYIRKVNAPRDCKAIYHLR